MPIFDYECKSCGKKFEELLKAAAEELPCPACGKPAKRVWSGEMFSSTGKLPKHCSGNCASCGGCGNG